MTERKHKDSNKPKAPRKISKRYLANSGLYYLQRFNASSEYFRFIMMRKVNKSCKHHGEENPSLEECAELLDQVITDFLKVGHLDDTAYCNGMVNSLRKRGLSRKAIIARLGQKRLPREMVNNALDTLDGEDATQADLIAAIMHARKKRLGAFARADKIPTDPEELDKYKNRHLGSLARAGYSFGIAQSVLNMPIDEAEDLLRENAW